MTAPHASDPATTLCTSCGLCCEGALHGKAALRPEEVNCARELGLPVLDDKLAFALPCPKLVNRCCSIYLHRPAVCSGYQCQLLIDLNADRVTLGEALSKVDVARQMFDALSPAPSSPLPDSAAVNVRKLKLTALSLFLDKHFINGNDGKIVSSTLVANAERDCEYDE